MSKQTHIHTDIYAHTGTYMHTHMLTFVVLFIVIMHMCYVIVVVRYNVGMKINFFQCMYQTCV